MKTTDQENSDLFKKTIKELSQPFIDLAHTSRALSGVNVSYLLEGLTYFGILGLLAIFYNDYIGLNDGQAGRVLGFLTGGITLSMLFLGATVDWIGVRKSFLYALLFMFIGRLVLSLSPLLGNQGQWGSAHIISLFGIVGIIIGYGIYQPAAYAAVKKFSTAKNAAMGYAMLYALMNLGGFLPGIISPPIRKSFGIPGVFWLMVVLTVIGMLAVAIIITKKAEIAATVENPNKPEESNSLTENNVLAELSTKEKLEFYWKNFPFRDVRFMFFIFILIPVQTLFAHNWLTLPQYTSRAFEGFVQSNFEFFTNLNPILIFILTPLVTALTLKSSTYKMMIIGTSIMSLPTFILTLGPNVYTLMAYLILMTIGEAMWQPRFLQWVAEIAPKNMTGIYMGIGQLPWFLTKVLTSVYSGWFLMNYCPTETPVGELHTEKMWFIYALIAISTPAALILARKWMMKGFKENK